MHQRRYLTSISSGMKIKSVTTALKNRAIHLRWAVSHNHQYQK
ncbi:hypothetical protein [uncultured Gammaproteobacteria bacterium]|nr:hypothetical protein [uncultured Gammaproteobacteria bacterium]